MAFFQTVLILQQTQFDLIAKPVRTISGGNAKATVDPDKMSIEDWMRHEQRRTAAARR